MTHMTQLLLMAEFGSDEPLWLRREEGTASRAIPLDRLPLTDELKQKLRSWAKLHDDLNDPPFSSGTREELEDFAEQGRLLLLDVRHQLGSSYDVHDRVGN